MAEYNSAQGGLPLIIEGKYSSSLDMEGFALMLKDPSYCYKFYWLEALVLLISEGVEETTFDAVIDEMIASAWYSVREFNSSERVARRRCEGRTGAGHRAFGRA